MSKSVLVIDTPDCCEKCPIDYAHCSEHGTKRYSAKSEWCPLRPLPPKLVSYGYLDVGNEDGMYEKGWNNCIDEILGEKE